MGGDTMLPIPFLQQLIRFYGGNMQKMVPSYLQFSLANLAKEQERIVKQFGTASRRPVPSKRSRITRKNVAMFEQAMTNAMTMFKPFNGPGGPLGARGSHAAGAVAAAAPDPHRPEARPEVVRTTPPIARKAERHAARKDDLAEMKAQMAAMQAMIEKLSKQR